MRELLGTILFYLVIIWALGYLIANDIWEWVKTSIFFSIFITLLCVSIYLLTGGF